MRSTILIVVVGLFLIMTGCTNDQYAIEKQYWQVQKQAEKIFKNPEATPPNELNRVVGLLGDFAKQYPKNNLSIDAQFNIGRLYIVKREYEKARAQLKTMLEQHSASGPICSEVLFLMGNSYEIEDKWNSAYEEYQKIIRQYPLTLRGLSVPIYIAQYYKIKYQPDKMITAYKEASKHYKALIDKYPDSALAFTAYQLMAQCYMENKDWQNAVDSFNAMIEKFKGKKANLDGILLNMALIYRNELKDKDKAKETLNKLIKDYPKSSLIKTALALLKEMDKNE